jgi:hypothetical protein
VTELVHQRPHTWKGDVERLFNALEVLGEARFRLVLQRALMQRRWSCRAGLLSTPVARHVAVPCNPTPQPRRVRGNPSGPFLALSRLNARMTAPAVRGRRTR